MQRLRKPLLMLLVATIVGAVAQLIAPSREICFTAGTVTYRLSPNAASADYRVAIDNQAPRPDLRIRLVDRVEAADFALTDDAGTLTGSACNSAGLVKTVQVVEPGAPSDITIAVTRQAANVDFSLYVHSARVSHFDAAALFALIRQSPDSDRELDGEQLAELH